MGKLKWKTSHIKLNNFCYEDRWIFKLDLLHTASPSPRFPRQSYAQMEVYQGERRTQDLRAENLGLKLASHLLAWSSGKAVAFSKKVVGEEVGKGKILPGLSWRPWKNEGRQCLCFCVCVCVQSWNEENWWLFQTPFYIHKHTGR